MVKVTLSINGQRNFTDEQLKELIDHLNLKGCKCEKWFRTIIFTFDSYKYLKDNLCYAFSQYDKPVIVHNGIWWQLEKVIE